MSGPVGLAVLIASGVAIVLRFDEGMSVRAHVFALLALILLNVLAGMVDARLGWHLWRRGRIDR